MIWQAPSTTSVSIVVEVYDDAGLAVTGLVAGTFPTMYVRMDGANTASTLTLTDLATLATAWTDSGLKEIGQGRYRLDIPNLVPTSGVCRIWGDASGKHVLTTEIQIGDVTSAALIADGIIGRNIAGGSSTGRTVGQALATLRNKVAFDVPATGQFTVYGTDDTTPLWTGTYTASVSAGPVTVLDPA
jgi:hypothetical protein